jgi:SAM-dependent methyltransferase
VTWNDAPKHWYEGYERGRPGYPAGVVEVADLQSSATVLDLGAGTGKLTRLLVSTFARVIAVEPDDEMRRMLVALCPEAEALAGSAEQIPLAGASVDAVFAAQSFHWFEKERALAEITRVLRPYGALVVIWNAQAAPAEPSIAAVEQLLDQLWPEGWDPLDLGPSRYSRDIWRLVFSESAFEGLHEAQLPNPQTVDREGLVAFFDSMGWIGYLPDGDRLPLLDRVRSLLTAQEYKLSWETHVYWTRLTQVGKRD